MDQAARARGASKPGTGTKRSQPHPPGPTWASACGEWTRANLDAITDCPAARLSSWTMFRAGSVRNLAVVALVAISCGPSHGTAPTHTSPSTASGARQQCPASQTPRFAPSTQSNRNLEIVSLKGSTKYVFRDITDILNPATVSTFEAPTRPQFVSANDVSFVDSDALVRMRLAGSSRTVVARCAGLFAWSPNGTTVVYVGSNHELHQVSGGQNRMFDSIPVAPGGYGCESRSCADSWDFRLLYSPNGDFITLNQLPPGIFRIWTSAGKLLKGLDFTDA